MVEIIRSIFGEYLPLKQTVLTEFADGSVNQQELVVQGISGINFEYIASVFLFSIVLYCLFKLIGVILKW